MTETTLEVESIQSSQSSASDQDIILAAREGGIVFIGKLSGYFFRFAYGILLARLLGPDLLGLYSLSLTATGVAGMLAVLGLNTGMARYVTLAASQKDEARLRSTIQIGITVPIVSGLILTIGLFLLAKPLAYSTFARPDLVPVLRLASLTITMYALVRVLASITQGFKRLDYQVYAENIAEPGVKLLLLAALLGIGLGVIGAMVAHILSVAVAMAMLFLFVHRLFPLNRPFGTTRHDIGRILSFTLPVYMSQLLSQFSGSIETLILGFSGAMSGVGVYTTALRLSEVGRMFHHSLQKIAVPLIADLHGQDKLDQLRRVYQTTTKWGMMFNLPIFLTLALFARPILTFLGKGYVAGTSGLVILAIGVLFEAGTGQCGSMITMTGRSRLTLTNSLVYLAANIALDLVLIPRWGAFGAALAVTLCGVLINTIQVVEVFVLLRMWPYDRTFLKPVVASLVAAGSSLIVSQRLASMPTVVHVILGTCVLWAVYAVVLLMLRLSEEDRLVLARLRARLGP